MLDREAARSILKASRLGRRGESERRAILARCAADPVWYVNHFVCTYNPKAQLKVVPFVLWDFQAQALLSILDHVERQRDLVIEKSRDMGASWMCVAALEWLWHFRPWTQSLMISREAEMVDGKTPDSLFWKFSFIHKWLPAWMMPKGFDPRRHRTSRYVENPENGSTATGQATTEKAGVGGRCTVMLFDEFSRVDRDFEMLDATADTAQCRLFNSTHRGTGTAFYGLTRNHVTDKLVLHWTEHPEKGRGKYRWDEQNKRVENVDHYQFPADFHFVTDGTPAGGPYPGVRSPWYDGECARRGSATAVAENLDIDVAGSRRRLFDAMLLKNLIMENCCEPYWEGEIDCDPDTGRPRGLLKMAGGPLRLWLHPDPRERPPTAPYGGGADISTGSGATPSVFSLANARTCEKVLEYASCNLAPDKFALKVVALCWLFHDENGQPARLAWEVPGPGAMFGQKVIDLGFRNVYYRELGLSKDGVLLPGARVSDKPGWHNNEDTARLLLEEYLSALSNRLFVNRHKVALQECEHFVYNARGHIEHAGVQSKGDPTGARVNHGDRVMGDALCWKIVKGMGLAPRPGREPAADVPASSLAFRRFQLHNARAKAEAWGY